MELKLLKKFRNWKKGQTLVASNKLGKELLKEGIAEHTKIKKVKEIIKESKEEK